MDDPQAFETITTVRRPRVVLMYASMALFVVLFVLAHFFRHQHPIAASLAQSPWWIIGPIIAAIQRRPKVEQAAVHASAEGIRVNGKLVPRAKLQSALLRREAGRSFVLLRGKGPTASSVDVAISSDEEADRLCTALALDAKSTTAEFTLMRPSGSTRWVLVLVALATAFASAAAMTLHHHHLLPLVILGAFGVLLTVGLPLLVLDRRVKILVGADGIAVKEGMKRRVFYSHEEIDGVSARGTTVFISRKHGPTMQFNVGSEEVKNKKQRAEFELQAQSIAWRLQKAREAYLALAGDAPQGALVLDRGERTASEWLEQLRRVGEGATATFRSVQLTREQLLRIVESTTAAAKERLAAAVALHAGLTEDEKPRVRVAAERCALPALRERMVRVVDASSDEELEAALAEAEEEERGAA